MNNELMVIAAMQECRNVEPRSLSMIRMEALVYMCVCVWHKVA